MNVIEKLGRNSPELHLPIPVPVMLSLDLELHVGACPVEAHQISAL